MDSLILSARIVAPIFTAVMLGYLLRRLGLWGDKALNEVNDIVFRVLFPIHLFYSTIHTDLSSTLNKPLLLAAVVVILLEFFLVLGVAAPFMRDKRRLGAWVQGTFRGNTLLFGMSIVGTLYGQQGVGTAALVVAVAIPLYNGMSVILMETCRGGRADPKKVLRGIVTNPLIVGTALGLVALACGVQLPRVVDESLKSITAVNTPLALMALGGTFRFSAVGRNWKALSTAVLGRLVVIPLLFIPVLAHLGFRGVEIASLLSILAVPTAVSSFTMAKNMEMDSELAGQIVVFTSLFSIVTIFAWVYFLSRLGYL